MSSAQNFTVQDNVLFDNYTFIGGAGPDCPWNGDAVPAPSAFIYDNSTFQVAVQSDFLLVEDGDSLTCTLPPDGGDYWPHGREPILSLENFLGTNVSSCDGGSCPAPSATRSSWTLVIIACAIAFAFIAWYLWPSFAKLLRCCRLGRPGRPRHKYRKGGRNVGEIPIATEVLAKGMTASLEQLGKRRTF